MGPAKKRGLFASWLKGKGADTEAMYDSPSGKGKERQFDAGDRQWDAGELDEEMRRIMNAVIFNGGLDYEYVITVHCVLTPVMAKSTLTLFISCLGRAQWLSLPPLHCQIHRQ
jgi:hypothetical protein